jgi:Family of unknown function (DUF6278)
MARGVAVMSGGGVSDPEQLQAQLSRCEHLRRLARERGVELTDDAASIDQLDSRLGAWKDDPDIGPALANEVAL